MDYPLNNQPATDRYDRMQYKYCGKSGLQLPLISLGLWHNFGSVDNFSVATDMIKYAFDHGITHFDLANNYGPVAGMCLFPSFHDEDDCCPISCICQG